MSVLIRDMEIPDNCSQCDAEWEDENPYGDTLTYRCPFIYKGYTDDFRSERRHNDCPLFEIKDKKEIGAQKTTTAHHDCGARMEEND